MAVKVDDDNEIAGLAKAKDRTRDFASRNR
jgi:hypothetical protein